MMFHFPYMQLHFELINAIFENQRLDLIRAFSVSEMQTILWVNYYPWMWIFVAIPPTRPIGKKNCQIVTLHQNTITFRNKITK